MAEDDVLAPKVAEHFCRDFAGERAVFFPVHILRAELDLGPRNDIPHGLERREGRAQHNLDIRTVGERGLDSGGQFGGLPRQLVHLPVTGNNFFAHSQDSIV